MTISFECITNEGMPWINTAIFFTDNGEITIDRTCTEYTYDPITGKMTMDWVNCYIWDGEDENFDIPDTFADHAILKELEVEDDAPANYQIRCIQCWVEGKPVPSLA